MSCDSLYGAVWRKAILFWNTKNSFYTNFRMFAIPQILTQEIQSFKKESIKTLTLEAEFHIPFAVMVTHQLVCYGFSSAQALHRLCLLIL